MRGGSLHRDRSVGFVSRIGGMRNTSMPATLIGRRRYLQAALALSGTALATPAALADSPAIAPIRELCETLLAIMRAGPSTPFVQRFQRLMPAIERSFDLQAILQLSVGPSWS